MLEPGDVLVDCTGSRSLLRDQLVPGDEVGERDRNTQRFRLEYALVITFLYSQHYACNEYCKYYKNRENPGYKFIPAVHRTYYDGSVSHVTGIVAISRDEYEAMPSTFDGAWLREHFPDVAAVDGPVHRQGQATRRTASSSATSQIMRIPLDVYRARNATSRRWRGSGRTTRSRGAGLPARRLGDRFAVLPVDLARPGVRVLPGRPYRQPGAAVDEMFERYEAFMYQQWLRVYMRTQMIKHNKDLLESVDDTMGLLAKLHVY